MCVICIKQEAEQFPSDELIRKMWAENPDGAGFMFPCENQVYIEKGFFKVEDFLNRIKALGLNKLDVPVIMHFRIATHGGVCKEMCHPFPLSNKAKSIKATSIYTNVGVAHNGIIRSVTPREGYSDTAEYIAKVLYPKYHKDKNYIYIEGGQEEILKEIGSRMCFMDAKGQIILIGDWKEKDGLLYSNLYFEDKYDYDSYDEEPDNIDDFGNADFYGVDMLYQIVYYDPDNDDYKFYNQCGWCEQEALGIFFKKHKYVCYADIASIYPIEG